MSKHSIFDVNLWGRAMPFVCLFRMWQRNVHESTKLQKNSNSACVCKGLIKILVCWGRQVYCKWYGTTKKSRYFVADGATKEKWELYSRFGRSPSVTESDFTARVWESGCISVNYEQLSSQLMGKMLVQILCFAPKQELWNPSESYRWSKLTTS